MYLSNADPARGHKDVRRSTGDIMVTARYSNQQGFKLRQNPCQVQQTENIENLSASRRCLCVRTTISTISSAASNFYCLKCCRFRVRVSQALAIAFRNHSRACRALYSCCTLWHRSRMLFAMSRKRGEGVFTPRPVRIVLRPSIGPHPPRRCTSPRAGRKWSSEWRAGIRSCGAASSTL